MTSSAKNFGRKADASNTLGVAVRAGLLCYGVMHLLVAWLAISLALGNSQGSTSTKGALSELAQKPFGALLLYAVAAGFVALAFWQLLETIAGHRDRHGAARKLHQTSSGFKVLIFGFLGYSSLKVATGSGSSGRKTDSLTAQVMSLPAGQILVGIVGLVIVGVGVALIYRGISEDFREHLDAHGQSGETGTVYVWLGKVGYVSKGLALFAVGGLFLWAAVSHDPDKSGGLDQALRTVLQQPFGPEILVAVAFGIGCFGLFTFAHARHLDP